MRNYFVYIFPILLVGLTAVLFFTKVNLEPEIKPNFFFSSDSPVYKQDQAIQREFPFQQQIILSVTTDNLDDPNYIEKITIISDRLQTVRGVDQVQSITHGPDDLKAATENPLWKRLLIGKDYKSSFIIIFVNTDDFEDLVKNVENIVEQEKNQWFDVKISGLPYIVEQIRRNLSSDMKTFTFTAIVLCSLVLFAVFRSFLVVLGAVISCVTAAMIALIVQDFIGISIGILTANVGTIIFVLTLSHIVFLVSNWWNAAQIDPDEHLSETVKKTLPASFWAAVTTFLGFCSLMFVEAKPLRELGISGSIGTFSALFCAYTVFPAFLKLSRINPSHFTFALSRHFPLSERIAKRITISIIIVAFVLGGFGINKVNTDPSLLSYFKDDTKLYQGLYDIDKNGGSSPLLLVIKRTDGKKLDNQESYNMMWDLQNNLNAHQAVGSVISLPIIMAEGDEHWLGQLLPWNILLDILSKPKYGAVAKSFVNEERTQALFMLRMQENNRDKDRIKIIGDIKTIPAQHGFEIVNTGGTYFLQAEMSKAVGESMIKGIITLIILFSVISFIVSRSFMVVLGVFISSACITTILIGTLGLLKIPVDIISSPAINVCLGLIVDNMIHITTSAKRFAKTKDTTKNHWKAWQKALSEQSWPAIISTLTIMIGFSVFALSDFPPSQRFGLEIVYGSAFAVILALAVFPYIATRKIFSKNKNSN